MTTRPEPPRRRRRRRRTIAAPRRFAPIALTALLALVAGLVVGSRHVPSQRKVVAAFGADWSRGDYGSMYALLDDAARERTSLARLQRTYRSAAEALTLLRVQTGRPTDHGDVVELPVTFQTRVFGRLRGVLAVPTGDRTVGGTGVDWTSELVYPGLRHGEKLRLKTTMPPRATIEARDGTPIARGPDRAGGLGPDNGGIAGTVGPVPPDRKAALAALGVPAGATVGLTGLERAFDDRLRGTPGGALYAGTRVLARRAPVRGSSVRTTIDPAVQRAAVEALAGRYGGIAVVRPSNGEILGLAGIAYSAPQPPGSTFKIITLAGVLTYHVAKRSATFPYQTSATIEGVEIQNANGESCGGTLEASFANSCNSVFAPLGAKLGGERLVREAERFGFNSSPEIIGAATSTIPAADQIGDSLAVGSSAIGQGKVLATPLQMALVAATVGTGGLRPAPTLLKGVTPRITRAASKPVAHTIARYMRSVVTSGTGAAAALPNVEVAGKTGTAELRTTVVATPTPATVNPTAPPAPVPTPDPQNTDAWFTAFAPLHSPHVAVAILLVGDGAGGASAAPAAREVLQAALG